jgi:hypothetical protein
MKWQPRPRIGTFKFEALVSLKGPEEALCEKTWRLPNIEGVN